MTKQNYVRYQFALQTGIDAQRGKLSEANDFLQP